jgi:hypothetical protein
VRTRPFTVEEAVVALMRVVCTPPAKVEVADDVEVMTPVVRVPMEEEATNSFTALNMVANSEVEVACENVCPPVHALVSERSVEEANDHVEVEKEYRRPAELTATPPVESEVMETEEVAVSVPVVKFPTDDEERKEFTKRPMVEKKFVLVALTMVVPPFESMTNAVVVPVDGTATTWKRFTLEETEEVAESVRTDSGEEVPMPTRVAPAV